MFKWFLATLAAVPSALPPLCLSSHFFFFCTYLCPLLPVEHWLSTTLHHRTLFWAALAIFFFCVPRYISGSRHFWWDFCLCDCFFFCNPALEVVTFRFHGWCIHGGFLLLVFTCPGHECQDLLSSCDGMHVFTDLISVYMYVFTDLTLVYTLIWKSLSEWSQKSR